MYGCTIIDFIVRLLLFRHRKIIAIVMLHFRIQFCHPIKHMVDHNYSAKSVYRYLLSGVFAFISTIIIILIVQNS